VKVTKSDCLLHHVCLSFRPHVLPPPLLEDVFVKSVNGEFYKSLLSFILANETELASDHCNTTLQRRLDVAFNMYVVYSDSRAKIQ